MKVAVIIGFCYAQCAPNYILPSGILVDLYLAYQHATRIGASKIVVITDYEVSHSHSTSYRRALPYDMIVDGCLDGDIVDFLNRLVRRKEIVHYINTSLFVRHIRRICEGASQVLLYYSGHCEEGKALMPVYSPPSSTVSLLTVIRGAHLTEEQASCRYTGMDRISLNTVFDMVTQHTQPNSQLLVILDCCPPHKLAIAYLYNKNILRSLRLISSIPRMYSRRRIVCIASRVGGGDVKEDEGKEGPIYATMRGSIFSSNVFKILLEAYSLRANRKRVSIPFHTVPGDILLSHPDVYSLWRWAWTETKLEVTACPLTLTLHVRGVRESGVQPRDPVTGPNNSRSSAD